MAVVRPVLLLLLLHTCHVLARPCSETDVYPGYPRPKYHPKYAHKRPYPEMMGCTMLDLANSKLTSDEAYTLARAIAYAENGPFRNISALEGVHTISFEGVPLGDAGATVLADAFGPAEPLADEIRLSLDAADVTSQGATALAAAVSASGSTIVSLTLDWNAIGDDGASALGRALVGNPRLTLLGLNRCSIGDAGAIELANALGKATAAALAAPPSEETGALATPPPPIASLRELRLEGNRIGAAGAMALARALTVNEALETLTLALNPIGPDGAKALASAIKHNPTLAHLDLADCGIGDEGAEALGNALRSNTALRTLRLQGNAIGAKGAAALAGAVQINPAGLRVLNLRLNQLDADAAAHLLEAVRHAKTTPEAGPGLHALDLEQCHVLPEMGRPPPPPVNASLLEELARVLASSGAADDAAEGPPRGVSPPAGEAQAAAGAGESTVTAPSAAASGSSAGSSY